MRAGPCREWSINSDALFVAVFLAWVVEAVEALTIVLAAVLILLPPSPWRVAVTGDPDQRHPLLRCLSNRLRAERRRRGRSRSC
jgi:hypothetical protein